VLALSAGVAEFTARASILCFPARRHRLNTGP
jgi:hypothetical protein